MVLMAMSGTGGTGFLSDGTFFWRQGLGGDGWEGKLTPHHRPHAGNQIHTPRFGARVIPAAESRVCLRPTPANCENRRISLFFSLCVCVSKRKSETRYPFAVWGVFLAARRPKKNVRTSGQEPVLGENGDGVQEEDDDCMGDTLGFFLYNQSSGLL